MIWKFMSLGLTLARIYRIKLMEKYLSFHLSYFDVTKNSPGSLLTRMAINTMELNQMLTTILGTTIQCGCSFIVGILIGCFYQYRLMLIDYSFVPVVLLLNILRRHFIESSSKRSITANIEAGGILTECVINTKTIFSFNFQHKAILMYLEVLDYVKRKFIRDAVIMGLFYGLQNFSYFAANACVYHASKVFIINDTMDTDDMSIIMNLVNISMLSFVISMGDLGNLKKAKVAFRSIYSTLETNSLIPPFRKDNERKISAVNIKGKIELKNVYFAYPTRPEDVILKNISFTIMPGQNVAIVGASGSGKSTIIQLLNRFYDVEEGKGEILIDDINIKDYNLYELRKKIGFVSQEPSIFKTALIENIRYGKLDASDNECIEAAREADSLNILEREEKGNKKKSALSGGQKQKIAIARVFLRNPIILLLDEATSALDKQSQIEVQNSLDKLSNNKTTISIAHRLSTIENSDKIFVFDKGRIHEQGTHEELMKLKKRYYTLQKYSSND